jgi:hypothetical protein
VDCVQTKDIIGATFEVYTAVRIEIVIFWVVAPCNISEDHVASIFRVHES